LLDRVAAPVPDAEPVGPALDGLPRLDRRHAVQLGEELQLVGDLHLGIEPALLGHVPDLAARLEVERRTVPAHRARGRREHPERGSPARPPAWRRRACVRRAPFGPTKPRMSPARTAKRRSRNAWTRPHDVAKPSLSSGLMFLVRGWSRSRLGGAGRDPDGAGP